MFINKAITFNKAVCMVIKFKEVIMVINRIVVVDKELLMVTNKIVMAVMAITSPINFNMDTIMVINSLTVPKTMLALFPEAPRYLPRPQEFSWDPIPNEPM